MLSAWALLPLLLAGSPLTKLKSPLDRVCAGFHGRIGYSVLDLKSGTRIENHADEEFPTASTIKTAIALEALKQVDEGRIKWTDQRVVPPEDGRETSMWSYYFKDGTKCDVDGWVNLMLTVSDNTATILLRGWLTPENVNATTAKLGLNHTKVLWSHFPDSDKLDRALREKYGLGVTTPHEMNRLWEMLYRRTAASPAACEKLLRILSHQYWDHLAGTTVPLGVQTCIKNGGDDDTRSECALVFAERPYILTIYTADQKDQRWEHDNEGEVTIRKMCSEIWKALEPNHPFTPPPGYEKFMATGGGVE